MFKFSFLFLLFLASFLFSQDDMDTSFITEEEYGQMLFENPRGISCVKCHGKDAKGKVIATFKHTTKKKKVYNCSIVTPNITHIDYNKFIQKLDPQIESKKPKFDKTQICQKLTYGNSMPTYFLTRDELKSIYHYLISLGKNN